MAKKNALFPIAYDEISLVDSGGGAAEDGSISPAVLIMKRASCVPPSSTGAKTGDSSQRAKNWQEGRHPRQQGGKFGKSSSKSKSQYGKGGTTSAKQEADCRKKKGGPNVAAHEKKAKKKLRAAGLLGGGNKSHGPKHGGRPVKKSDSWKSEARLRALIEREAARW